MIQNQTATALCPAPSPSSRVVQERQVNICTTNAINKRKQLQNLSFTVLERY